ncbi:MAG: hypothetical protein JWN08_89 [Frankiales bacterium]|nr:hypothetical protein [Frankiales bacterium]
MHDRAPESVQSLVDDVWSSYVGAPLVPRPVVAGDDLVGRSIAISGDWCGTVQVQASRALAVTVASAMFSTGAAEITDTDVSGALGEITNIVGGNVKSLLGGECRLALPSSVGHGPDTAGHEVPRLELDAAGEPLVVVVWREGRS